MSEPPAAVSRPNAPVGLGIAGLGMAGAVMVRAAAGASRHHALRRRRSA